MRRPRHLPWAQGPRLLLPLEAHLQLFDLLVVVLPLGDDPHGSFQLGLFGHRIVTLQKAQNTLQPSTELTGVSAHGSDVLTGQKEPRGGTK